MLLDRYSINCPLVYIREVAITAVNCNKITFRREIEINTFFICKRKQTFALLIGVMLLCAILEA